MGLDNYFRIRNENDEFLLPLHDIRLMNINLCGGMFSGSGNSGSFRGKAYSNFLEKITDNKFTLYEEEQSPKDYFIAIEAMRNYIKDNPKSNQEIRDLLLLFEVAYEKKAYLLGWW